MSEQTEEYWRQHALCPVCKKPDVKVVHLIAKENILTYDGVLAKCNNCAWKGSSHLMLPKEQDATAAMINLHCAILGGMPVFDITRD